jgi:guanylate kinase
VTLTAPEARSSTTLPRGFRPRGFPLVLSGPSGVGKTSVVSHLLSRDVDIVFSVSATTRPRREGESEGREYFYYDEERFARGVEGGEFVEHASVHGRWYGTPKAPLEAALAQGRIVILDVDVQGGRSLRRACPDGVFVFVYPPSLEALEARLRGRATDAPQVIAERLANAPGEMARYVEYDYVIVNDDLTHARATMDAILAAERARVSRLDPR